MAQRFSTAQSLNVSMTQSLNLVFCGTPRFAVPTLEKLVAAGLPHSSRRHSARSPQRPRPGTRASPVKAVRAEAEHSDHAARSHQDQRRIPRSTHRAQARRNHRRRLRPHHSAMDARSSAARQHQPARLAASEISRRRADSMGHRERRNHHRRHDHAHRRRPRHRRHSSCNSDFPSRPTTPRKPSRRASPPSAPIWSVETLRGLQAGSIHPPTARQFPCHPRPDPEERRRPRGFLPLRGRNLQPHARLSALARRATQNSAARICRF